MSKIDPQSGLPATRLDFHIKMTSCTEIAVLRFEDAAQAATNASQRLAHVTRYVNPFMTVTQQRAVARVALEKANVGLEELHEAYEHAAAELNALCDVLDEELPE